MPKFPAPRTPPQAATANVVQAIEEAIAPALIEEGEAAEAAEPAPEEALRLAGWVTASRDNEGLPFIVIDKIAAEGAGFAGFAEFAGRPLNGRCHVLEAATVEAGPVTAAQAVAGAGEVAHEVEPREARRPP